MAQYLDKFNSTVKSKQVEQILDKLTKEKETGEIRSLEEFTNKFNKLVADLFSIDLTPSLKIEEGDEVISSEVHNEMLQKIDNDLKTSAGGINQVEDVQTAHRQLINQSTITKKIYDQIRELEIKTEVYKGLKYNPYGFDGAIYSNFNGSKQDQLEYNDQTKDLFKDTNSFLHLQIEKDQTALINEDQTLSLREKNKKEYLFNNVYSFSSVDWETYAPVLEDEQNENIIFPIENLLKEDETFYKKEYVSTIKTSFKDFALKLSLSESQLISFLKIKLPFSSHKIFVKSIYIDNNMEGTTPFIWNVIEQKDAYGNSYYSNTSLNPITIFRFKAVYAKDFYINFRILDPEYSESQEQITTITDILKEEVESENIAQYVPILKQNLNIKKYWKFSIDIENISCGLVEYENKTCYISKPLEIENILNLGLKINKLFPEIKQLDSTSWYPGPLNAIPPEYNSLNEDIFNYQHNLSLYPLFVDTYIVKEKINQNNLSLGFDIFSIIPLIQFGESNYFQEYSLWKPLASSTWLLSGITGVDLYSPLPYITDALYGNLLSSSSALYEYNYVPDINIPMKEQIFSGTFEMDCFYTFITSANWRVSSSVSIPSLVGEYNGTTFPYFTMDLIGDLTARLNEGFIIAINKDKESPEVVKYKFYLMIMLRNESTYRNLTPIVLDYTLFYNIGNPDKFKEE
jgi:hypothetical protein